MSAPELRPLALGEILDAGIKIYWRNAGALFGLIVLIVLPAQILTNLITASLPDSSSGDSGTLIAGRLAALIIGGIAGTIATAACFKAVADAYLGEKASFRTSLGFVLPRSMSVLWLTLLTSVVTVAALLLFIIPGVYLWAAFAVAIPVLLMEDARGSKALGRSRALVRGLWWKTFGLLLIVTIMTGIVAGAIGGLAAGFALTTSDSHSLAAFLVGTLTGTLAKMLTTPFTAAVTTVLYFDLRVRKEGFDLQLVAERLGLAPGGFALAPPTSAGFAPRNVGGSQPPYWPPPPGWKPTPEPTGGSGSPASE